MIIFRKEKNMKKFFILFTAVALVCAFGIPAMAADAPAWNFYGSARMATWYSNTSEELGRSVTNNPWFGNDDSGTIWELQGNARIGATVKGETIGGASVSRRHANFIITKPNATASDVINLMKLMKQRVFSHAGIELKEEIVIWRRGEEP